MSKRFTGILIFLFLAASLGSQIPVKPVPDWVTVFPINDKFKPNPDDISGGYFIISQGYQIHTPSRTENIQEAKKVFNGAGVETVSSLNIYFDPAYESLTFHRIGIMRRGEMIDQHKILDLSYSNIEESADQLMYDGRKMATIHFKDVRTDDILYINYSRVGQNPVFGDHIGYRYNLHSSDSMDRLNVIIVVPSDEKIIYKVSNLDLEPQISTKNGLTSYSWERTNLSGTSYSEYPYWYDPYPGLYISDFDSWKDVIQWALPLFTVKETPSPQLAEWIDSVKIKYPEEKDRATYAIRWVQNNVRYLGLEFDINSHKPAEPNQVFRNRHGDCKDKSLLLCEMLDLLGIKASPVLVNTYLAHTINEVIPSTNTFNHCIVSAQVGAFTFFVDPTIKFQGGIAPEIYTPYYGYGLVVSPEAVNLEKLPIPMRSTIDMHEELFVSKKGEGGSMRVTTKYTGGAADKARADYQYNSLNEAQELFRLYYERLYDEVMASGNLSFIDDSISNEYTVTETYDVGNFWKKVDSTNEASRSYIYLSASLITENLPKIYNENYRGPLDIRYPFDFKQHIAVHMPNRQENSLADQHIYNDAFEYDSKFTIGFDTIIHAEYTLTTTEHYIKEENLIHFLGQRKSIEEELNLTVYKQQDNAGITGIFFHIAISILSVLLFSLGGYFLYRWDPDPKIKEANYERIGGWLVLPSIGVMITIFFSFVRFYNSSTHARALWQLYQINGIEQLQSWNTALIISEVILNAALLCYAVTLLFLFFNRRSSVPVLMILFYLGAIVILSMDLITIKALSFEMAFTEADIKKTKIALVRGFLASLIWIPYFMFSERVSGTFVEKLHVEPLLSPPPILPATPPPLPLQNEEF